MAGTRAGAIKGWLHRLEKKVNNHDVSREWQIKLDEFKRRHNQELVDELNKGWQDVTGDDESPYYLDEDTLDVDGESYTNYVEDGVPPGGKVDNGRIVEWIINVKHPDINFSENKETMRELDRIAYRIGTKIRRYGIEAKPHRAAAVEKLRRKYNNVRFGQRT